MRSACHDSGTLVTFYHRLEWDRAQDLKLDTEPLCVRFKPWPVFAAITNHCHARSRLSERSDRINHELVALHRI